VRTILKIPLAIESSLNSLLERRLPDGGFGEQPGGDYRSDSTSWAILCLSRFQIHDEIVSAARTKLCKIQLPDGSIPLSPDYPNSYWPTAAASRALAGISEFSSYHSKALQFLLTASGEAWTKGPDSPLGHDTSIKGWSWIPNTHSWVEPTAMAIRALASAGEVSHQRVKEGVRLLLDRQLPDGGWNYGNTTVYGKTLNAMPAVSGVALWALAGLVDRSQISPSLNQLAEQLPKLHTPYSLGWALHGLTAWGIEIPKSEEMIATSLQQQGRYGTYGTSQLCVLLTTAGSHQTNGQLM